MDLIYKFLKQVKKIGLYPSTPKLMSPHAPEVIIDGRKVLMFATNNYLDLMTDSRVIRAAIEGTKRWGIGNGSARLLTGNLEIHGELEQAIAKFKHRESALTFVSGYMANEGAIPAITNVIQPSIASFLTGSIKRTKGSIIFSDEYNHASIIAGVRLSDCHKEIYRHVDMDDLEARLKKYSKRDRKIIISDGVFSMDGDVAPLPTIVELAKKYHALVYLDDAHATGVLGKNGRGLEEFFNIENSVDIVMGTFTKAFGGVGGFIGGSQELIDYLKITANTFIFTAPIAPPIVCGLIRSIQIADTENWRREAVINNAAYLREKLKEEGFNTGNSTTQIIPLMIGEEKKAVAVSNLLLQKNIFIPAARWPAVPSGAARLRMTVSCAHTKSQIDFLVKNIKHVREKIKF